MKKITAENLDEFVTFIDEKCNGNLSDPKFLEKYTPIDFVHKTEIDYSIDPFCESYFQSQIDLYKEISGRPLDQWSGELHPVENLDILINSQNPQGVNNATLMSENVRAVSSMLSLSCLDENAKILDMGAGHGMSSEVYAFCGCDVHAIDIDPILSDLSTKRAGIRSLKIKRSLLNFDSLSSIGNNDYDAAFFFQSFHHALRPWKLIEELKDKLSDEGVIAFCGEPIQNIWHKYWGIRMDVGSLYVAHKFGWFESGWTHEFISECFARNGLKLILLNGGHQGGLIGITSKDNNKLNIILNKALDLGFSAGTFVENELTSQNYQSQIGRLSLNRIRPSIIIQPDHLAGYACYGPYISLPTGNYRVSFITSLIKCTNNKENSSFLFDIVSDSGQITHYTETISINEDEKSRLVIIEFNLNKPVSRLEARVYITKSSPIKEISLPLIEQIYDFS